jgi:hypothetical protein
LTEGFALIRIFLIIDHLGANHDTRGSGQKTQQIRSQDIPFDYRHREEGVYAHEKYMDSAKSLRFCTLVFVLFTALASVATAQKCSTTVQGAVTGPNDYLLLSSG